MFAELGLTGWLLVALGWLVAGLGLAWVFGRFVQAGKGERSDREVPSAVRLYSDRVEESSRAPDVIEPSLNGPAKY